MPINNLLLLFIIINVSVMVMDVVVMVVVIVDARTQDSREGPPRKRVPPKNLGRSSVLGDPPGWAGWVKSTS